MNATTSFGVTDGPRRDDSSAGLALLRDVVATYRQVTSMAVHSCDLGSVTDLLAKRLDTLVWVVTNPPDQVIAASSPALSPQESVDLVHKRSPDSNYDNDLRSASRTRLVLRSPLSGANGWIVTAPIVIDDAVVAYLRMLQELNAEETEEMALLVMEHAATICGIVLGRERAVAGASSRVRDDLVEGLLYGRGTDDELRRWARHLGYDDSRPYRLIEVSANLSPTAPRSSRATTPMTDRLPEVVSHYFKSWSPLAIVSVRDDDVVILLPDDAKRHHNSFHVARECIAYANGLFSGCRLMIGVSRCFSDPTDVPSAYNEAHRTIELARSLGRYNEVIAFEALGVHRLLMQVPERSELEAFAESVLGPVKAYGQGGGLQLMETLRAYFQENGSRRNIARRLYVHPNTVDYRLKRLAQVAGLNLDQYRDRLMAQIALEIYDVLEGRGLE